MIKLCKNEQCTGCMACYNACAVGAISVTSDKLGVLHPDILKDKCISCGSCTKACPILNPMQKNHPHKAYALYTKKELDRRTCSSGGVATTLYRSVLDQGGIIVGAALGEDGKPYFKCSDSPQDIECFKGSKYVYVFPDKAYSNILRYLKDGRLCLFVGTPCQVDGLRTFLKKDYTNLITVDLICHGTPPFAYLNEYLSILTGDEYIPEYTFRGVHDYYLTLWKDKKEDYCKKCEEDLYFLSFLSGLIHRPICFQCPYSNEMRGSDITIGDFWGLPGDALNGYKGKISLALVNTEKGQKFLSSVLDRFVWEARETEEAISGNSQLRQPSVRHADREKFVQSYQKTGSFRQAVLATSLPKQVRKNRIKNAILKYPRIIKHKLLKN